MTKRKPRRKAPKKSQRSTGWVWWTAGLLSLGWIVFDANRAAILSLAPELAGTVEQTERRVSSAPTPAAVESPARPAAGPQRSPAAVAAAVKEAAPLPRRNAALPDAPIPVAAVPTGRPAPASRTKAAGLFTSRPTPLRRAPSADMPVWITLDAGRPLRVTAREGSWRRVESGIFTGWIRAEFVEAQALPQATPARTASSEANGRQPVPPGAIPVAPR